MKVETIMRIACIPCSVCEIPPTNDGQTGYRKEPCQKCKQLMWTTDRKRDYNLKHPETGLICMLCSIKELRDNGDNPATVDFVDLTKMN